MAVASFLICGHVCASGFLPKVGFRGGSSAARTCRSGGQPCVPAVIGILMLDL